ncbi:MAG TPA: chain-length determining protein [Caulobacteraceae bacterium]|nr:chain-length determining protein [Caulobacteraceae bacterium]
MSGDVTPARRRAGWRSGRLSLQAWLFLLMVVIPSALATVYFLLVAAPLYVSEARFVVRARAESAGPGGLGLALASVGVDVGEGQTDAFEVHEYMTSRDAVADLEKRVSLRALLGRPEGDFLARFPRPFENTSFEQLYKEYQRFVTVGYNPTTGISTLRVEAFRPGDAEAISAALLDGGEALVNRLNDRAAQDSIAEAQREVVEAQARSVQAQAALTDFRNREQLIDPTRSAGAGLELVSQLEGQLATLKAERAGQAALTPQSAELPVLDRRIAAYEAQVAAEQAKMAGQTSSLAPKIGEYERLSLERDFADKTVATADAALEEARVDARQKQLYLERVVYPNTPDRAERPQRLLSILMVVVTCFIAFAMVVLVLVGLREHQQA